MLQPLERTEIHAWCGRSWEALVERRSEALAEARALQRAVDADAYRVVSAFLEYFDTTGIGLMRDEEEWIFRSLRPVPRPVVRALEEHIAISSLIQALIDETRAGCVDLRVIHRLGELLESHLVAEEEDVRPLVTKRLRGPLAAPST